MRFDEATEEFFRDKFWPKVVKTDTCWIWTGAMNDDGYGRPWFGGRRVQAHRLAYERLVGPIPAELVIDHLCRNRACVNPAHMEPVTNRENVLRGVGLAAESARQTHCVNGHPFDAENTRTNAAGHRMCRACDRDRGRRRYEANRERENEASKLRQRARRTALREARAA